ncbi:uncharacterized protein METZ01_LOCUS262013 [marine metagenome]|uniref:Uncharacterized protein n=1 Tax=marine metagenome TaxID=408172 RepID=A0A382JBX8_9ZZZZ
MTSISDDSPINVASHVDKVINPVFHHTGGVTMPRAA